MQCLQGSSKGRAAFTSRVLQRSTNVWFEQRGATIAEANEWFVVPLKAIDEAIHLIRI